MHVVFPFNLYNNAVYNLKHLTTKDTFRVVSLYADHFDDKNLKSFTTWCSRKKKDYIFQARYEARVTFKFNSFSLKIKLF